MFKGSEMGILGYIWMVTGYPIISILLFLVMAVYLAVFDKEIRSIRTFTKYIPLVNLLFPCMMFFLDITLGSSATGYLTGFFLAVYLIYIIKRWQEEIKIHLLKENNSMRVL